MRIVIKPIVGGPKVQHGRGLFQNALGFMIIVVGSVAVQAERIAAAVVQKRRRAGR